MFGYLLRSSSSLNTVGCEYGSLLRIIKRAAITSIYDNGNVLAVPAPKAHNGYYYWYLLRFAVVGAFCLPATDALCSWEKSLFHMSIRDDRLVSSTHQRDFKFPFTLERNDLN